MARARAGATGSQTQGDKDRVSSWSRRQRQPLACLAAARHALTEQQPDAPSPHSLRHAAPSKKAQCPGSLTLISHQLQTPLKPAPLRVGLVLALFREAEALERAASA